jgi:hypothetical protein
LLTFFAHNVTVLDVTNPLKPEYAFLLTRDEPHKILSAREYSALYKHRRDDGAGYFPYFDKIPLIDAARIREIWPSRLTILAPEKPQKVAGDTRGEIKAETFQDEVPTLRELSMKQLIASGLEQEQDASWFDYCDLEIFPELPMAVISHISAQIERGVDIMRISPSAPDVVSQIFSMTNRDCKALDFSVTPYNTMTGDQLCKLLDVFFYGTEARSCCFDELNLSNNSNITSACVQKILGVFPIIVEIKKLVIFNCFRFQPDGLNLSPRLINTPACAPDILIVQNAALSALTFPKTGTRSRGFHNMTKTPSGLPSSGYVGAMVLCFPKFTEDVVPVHIPFHFAHPKTAAVASIDFFKCMVSSNTDCVEAFPTMVAKVFDKCNAMDIQCNSRR